MGGQNLGLLLRWLLLSNLGTVRVNLLHMAASFNIHTNPRSHHHTKHMKVFHSFILSMGHVGRPLAFLVGAFCTKRKAHPETHYFTSKLLLQQFNTLEIDTVSALVQYYYRRWTRMWMHRYVYVAHRDGDSPQFHCVQVGACNL